MIIAFFGQNPGILIQTQFPQKSRKNYLNWTVMNRSIFSDIKLKFSC